MSGDIKMNSVQKQGLIMETLTPSERRYQKKRQEILDAARTLLVQGGVDAISMRILADKVDYSVGALYKYFASKAEIIEALRQDALELMANFQPEMPEGLSLGEMFVHSGKNYIQFASQYPEHYQLIMSSSATGPANMDEFVASPDFRELHEFVKIALAAGEFELPEGYDSFHLALLSWFMVHGISLLKLTMMSNFQDEFEEASIEVIEMVKEVFTKNKEIL